MHFFFFFFFFKGRFTIAAKHHITVAEIYENELADIEQVSKIFIQLLPSVFLIIQDFFNYYSTVCTEIIQSNNINKKKNFPRKAFAFPVRTNYTWSFSWQIWLSPVTKIAQSAGAVEYTDCTPTESKKPPSTLQWVSWMWH